MLNETFLAVHSGEHCGPWASGFIRVALKRKRISIFLVGSKFDD